MTYEQKYKKESGEAASDYASNNCFGMPDTDPLSNAFLAGVDWANHNIKDYVDHDHFNCLKSFVIVRDALIVIANLNDHDPYYMDPARDALEKLGLYP